MIHKITTIPTTSLYCFENVIAQIISFQSLPLSHTDGNRSDSILEIVCDIEIRMMPSKTAKPDVLWPTGTCSLTPS